MPMIARPTGVSARRLPLAAFPKPGHILLHRRCQARLHDHAQFEIFCYADVRRRDEITTLLQEYADVWRDVADLSDEQIATTIRDDRIDILVDLTMHMADARPLVFARKPAPVQVAWLAYPGTTGLTTMDYRLTDPYLDPFDAAPFDAIQGGPFDAAQGGLFDAAQGGLFDAAQGGRRGVNDAYYSEISYRLPDTALCYDPLTTEPAVNPLPALKEGRVTFGSLNHFAKANDIVLGMWAATLATVPDSRMLVLAPQGKPPPAARKRRRRRWAGDPRQVEFLDRRPRREYLEYFHRIDIVLDTFPYNGETTSLDGLWMGVPMITLRGTTVTLSRAGMCYHSLLCLEDLVAHTPEEYPRIATKLGA